MDTTIRTWRAPADWRAIAEVFNAEAIADGTEFLRTPEELAVERRPNSNPAEDVFVAERAGRIVGAVIGSWAVRDGRVDLFTEGAVHPEARRQGVGTSLLQAAQARLAAATAAESPTLERRFSAWTSEQQVGAVALLQSDGYAIDRYGFEMARRDLAAQEPILPPPGIEIRPGTVADARTILTAEHEAFRDHPGYREWTEADYQSVFEQPFFDPTIWRAAWDGDEVAGAVETWILETENATLGVRRAWLGRVSVRRPWRQQGIARALIAETFAALHARGITEAMLGVDAQNPSGALRLYESMGFEKVRTGLLFARAAPR